MMDAAKCGYSSQSSYARGLGTAEYMRETFQRMIGVPTGEHPRTVQLGETVHVLLEMPVNSAGSSRAEEECVTFVLILSRTK
jgi:hypothetical protein